jgi:sulfate adenylyltransferase subunit 1 (EFTu-like GTPase family)
VLLEDELDISRGDMLVGAGEQPQTLRTVEATVCWMTGQPLVARGRYIVRHTTREVKAVVDEVVHKIDMHSMEADPSADRLELNDIGTVKLRLSGPLVVDNYRSNRETGSFILIDEATNATVGAAMITGAAS